MNADQIRYAKKIATYKAAVDKCGFASVESAIGSKAAGKLEMAMDAFNRRQADYIVADFLADAQSTIGGMEDYDIYDVLRSI